MGESISFRRCVRALVLQESTRSGSVPWRVSGAPNSRQSRSTSVIASSSCGGSRYSPNHPPTSGLSVSLPSENAPAPPQPQVMSHGSQWAQMPVVRAGQRRSEISQPFSTRRMRSDDLLASSSAAKMPAGPAPTMITSKRCSGSMRSASLPGRPRSGLVLMQPTAQRIGDSHGGRHPPTVQRGARADTHQATREQQPSDSVRP